LRRTLGIYSEEIDALTDGQHGIVEFCEGNDLNLAGSYSFHEYAELIHPETATMIAAYGSECYAGSAAATVNHHGNGKAYFIAARTNDDLLYDFYKSLAQSENIIGALSADLPKGVTAQVRETDSQRFVFLMNFTNELQKVDLGDAQFADQLTGLPVADVVTLYPYDISIFSAPIS